MTAGGPAAHDPREALAAYRGVESLVINGTMDTICPSRGAAASWCGRGSDRDARG